MTPFERVVRIGRLFQAAAVVLCLAGAGLTGLKLDGLDWPWIAVLAPFAGAALAIAIGMAVVRDRLP